MSTQLSGGIADVLLLVHCVQCRVHMVFSPMWVRTTTRWSDSSNRLPVTHISKCHEWSIIQARFKKVKECVHVHECVCVCGRWNKRTSFGPFMGKQSRCLFLSMET